LFDFTNLIRGIYASGNVTLNDMDTVTVSQLDFLTNALSIMGGTSSRIIQNYFVWHFMLDQAGHLPRDYRFLKEEFERVFEDVRSPPPRTIRCGYYVNNNMGFVVSKLYIKTYFDDNARNQVLKIIYIY
jgi:predicted metalloendopeptidase